MRCTLASAERAATLDALRPLTMDTTSRDGRAFRAAARLWRYAWPSPATLVGLGLAAVALAAGASVRRVDGVLEVAAGMLGRAVNLLPAGCRFCAITFG